MRWGYKDQLSLLERGGVTTTYNEQLGTWEATDSEGLTESQLIEQYREKTNRLNAISGVYQRADRIVTGQDLIVNVIDDKEMKAPASTTGKTISFNASYIPDLEGDSIVMLHGLNYHEVAHVLFSPRAGSELARYVKDNKYSRAFFILEEARAEKLLIAKYSVTRMFLEATIMKTLIEPADDIGGYFPLITGRTYLPLELRQAVVDRAVATLGKDIVTRLHKIIHEYRNLAFPTDFDKAKELVQRMAEIVGTDEEIPTSKAWDIREQILKEGRPANAQSQKHLQDREKDYEAETIGDNESKDGAGIGDGAGVGVPDKHATYDGADNDFNNPLAELLNERLEQIKNDRLVKREISDTRKAILGSDFMKLSMKNTDFISKAVDSTSQVMARRFSQELQQLVLDQDPKWDTERPYGKLIPKRTMNPDVNNIGRVFDRWSIGNDNTEIEAVILLDNSSSMGRSMTTVCESAWILKRAIESVQGSVTIYSFNHESKLLYGNKDRANASEFRYVYSSGNTNPIRGLMEAERLMNSTKKPIKLLFIVTDGEWDKSEACDSIISSMKESGVYTSVIYIEDNYDRLLDLMNSNNITEREYAQDRLKRYRHGADLFRAVGQPRDMLAVAQTLVKELVTHERSA